MLESWGQSGYQIFGRYFQICLNMNEGLTIKHQLLNNLIDCDNSTLGNISVCDLQGCCVR